MGWIGRQIGDFTLLRLIGEGAFGLVFEAEQVSLPHRVALKMLKPKTVTSPQEVERFRREARTAAKLNHPHIVPVHSLGEEEGTFYLTMQLVEGVSLADCLPRLPEINLNKLPHLQVGYQRASAERPEATATASLGQDQEALPKQSLLVAPDPKAEELQLRRGRLAWDYFRTVARLGAEAAEALAYAHGQGILHCDVKPHNLLVDRYGRLVVTDFGLALLLKEPLRKVPGQFFGTLGYASPEQLTAGQLPLDERTDIYSLGVTLYELLALVPPFTADSRDALVRKVLYQQPTGLRRLVPQLPTDLESVVQKAMHKDPDRRYQGAEELATDLRRFLRGEAPKVLAVGPLGRAWRMIRQHRRVAVPLLVLAVIGVIAAIVMGYLYWDSVQGRRAEALLKQALSWRPGPRYWEAKQERQQMLEGLNRWGGRLNPVRVAEARARLGRLLREERCQTLSLSSVARSTTLRFSSDGRWLACGDDDGGVSLWKLSAGGQVDPLPRLSAELGRITCLAFDEDGEYLAAAGMTSPSPRVWDLNRPDRDLQAPAGPEGTVRCVVLATRRQRVHSGTRLLWFLEEPAPLGWALWSWDAQAETPTKLWDPDPKTKVDPSGLLLSPDGLFWGALFPTGLKCWNIESRGDTVPATVNWPKNWPEPRWGALSTEASVGVVGSQKNLTVWSLDGDKAEKELASFASDPTDPNGGLISCPAALTPDGQWLAWADGDVLRICDVTAQSEPTVLLEYGREWAVTPHRSEGRMLPSIMAVALSPGGHWLAAASWDGKLHVWHLEPLLDHLSAGPPDAPGTRPEPPKATPHTP